MKDRTQNPDAYVSLIAALVERGRPDDARQKAEEALRLWPEDPDLTFQAAHAEYACGHLDVAQTLSNRVLSLNPQHTGAREVLFWVARGRGDAAGAEHIILALLREYPGEPTYLGYYALLMLGVLHLDKAEALAREGLKRSPEEQTCLVALGISDLIRGRKRSETIVDLIRNYPQSLSTGYLLISALADRGQPGAALRVAREMLRAWPGRSDLVTLVRELETAAHWSLMPLRPFVRYGWVGVAAVWGGSMLVLLGLGQFVSKEAAGGAGLLYLGFTAYSWLYPPVFKRLRKR